MLSGKVRESWDQLERQIGDKRNVFLRRFEWYHFPVFRPLSVISRSDQTWFVSPSQVKYNENLIARNLNWLYLTPSLGRTKLWTLCTRANERLPCQGNIMRTIIVATFYFRMPITLSGSMNKLAWTQIASSAEIPWYCLQPMTLLVQPLQTCLQKAKREGETFVKEVDIFSYKSFTCIR